MRGQGDMCMSRGDRVGCHTSHINNIRANERGNPLVSSMAAFNRSVMVLLSYQSVDVSAVHLKCCIFIE